MKASAAETLLARDLRRAGKNTHYVPLGHEARIPICGYNRHRYPDGAPITWNVRALRVPGDGRAVDMTVCLSCLHAAVERATKGDRAAAARSWVAIAGWTLDAARAQGVRE